MKGRRTNGIGLAIVGAGRVGLFRGEVAARHPAVEWIGIAELNDNRGKSVAAKIGADFVTTDHRELLARPEATCAIICSDEHLHVDPVMCAVENGLPMLIEKPLATTLKDSARVLPRSKLPGSMRWSAIPSASAAAGSLRRRNAAPARSATSRWSPRARS